MPKKIDLTDQKFSYLKVIGESGKKDKDKKSYWWCQCTRCGNFTCVHGNSLRSGHKRSCGCLQKERNKELKTTHGMSSTTIYKTWINMLSRCNNRKNPIYKHYGGRGISVCDHWLVFENFYKDMGEKPEGKSIERIDNNRNYCPNNCCWITQQEQCYNMRCKGYFYSTREKKWLARIKVEGKQYHLGSFNTPEEALAVYKRAWIKRANGEIR